MYLSMLAYAFEAINVGINMDLVQEFFMLKINYGTKP